MPPEYKIAFNVDRDTRPGESEFEDLVSRYHGAILSDPINDAGILGKGFAGTISPDEPVRLEELQERYHEIMFTGFEPVLA